MEQPSPTVEQSKKPTYKYCIVPKCRNTIRNAPDKVFFLVPRGETIRSNWCKIMKRDMVSPSTCLYCCEDHFDVEEDTDNFMEYKIMNLQEKQKTKLRLKKGILPHKFQCQKDTELEPQPVREAFLKRIHLEEESIIDDVLTPDDFYIPTATHIGYVCGACGNRIDGFRYACVQCEDYDQCAECEASGAHAEHYVLRVPRVERATEHETVLGRVRRELKQVNIPVELKLEKDDAAEKSIVIKEEVIDPEDVDPLRGAGVGAGDGAVKQEVIDPEHNAMTATGQVPVSGPSPTGEASHTEAGAGGASRPEVVDQSPEMLWMGAGGGAVKQEAVVSDDDSLTFDRFTEATGAHLRTYEASRRRAVASEPVSPSAATGEASSRGGTGAAAHSRLSAELTVAGRAERPRRAAASRDARLSELAFDSKRAPRKRRKVEESGD